MKNATGFTLIELIIVIVIVGILSIVAVPIYRGYVQKSLLTEAKALTGSILSSQRVYYAENGKWYELGNWVEYDDVLTVDARGNKFFRQIRTKESDKRTGTYEAGAFSSDKNLSVFQYWQTDPNEEQTAQLPRWDIYEGDGSGETLIAVEW